MKKYQHLIGKSKKELLEELGDEFNYLPASVWTYKLKRAWLFRRKLYIYFSGDEVVKIKIKKFI